MLRPKSVLSTWWCVAVLVLGAGACGTDWEQICADLHAAEQRCGQVVLPACGESVFGECTNEGEIADDLDRCASDCTALADCTSLTCNK
jgi:hypothetical protein